MIAIPRKSKQPDDGDDSMAQKVNLDALIKRADFETLSGGRSGADETGIVLIMLKEEMGILGQLRKPQFQRATSDWTSTQVRDLIKAFVDRDLIPAIIVWNSPSRLHFIMDGAHRLSALIAWVNDDYGDGPISQKLRGVDGIDAAHKAAHKATKTLIDEAGLNFAHLEKIGSQDGIGSAIERHRGVGMTSLQITIQRYNNQDPRIAERAFYRINQGGTPLDSGEREVIRTRRATRNRNTSL